MSLENELRQAMRRVPAPEGFAERVLARLGRPGFSPAAGLKPGLRRWRAVAATLLLGAIVGGWGAHEAVERRREGQHAREQVLLALRIAGTQVARAQREARDHMAR